MKHPYLISAFLALLPVVAIGTFLVGNSPRDAEADGQPFRCTDSSFYFPVTGVVGWTYMDPASTDRNASGAPTVHTGIDVFADAGPGAPVYAPADGVVSREYGPERVNLVLTGVTNLVDGELGVEVYLSHVNHSLVPGQTFKAGDVIATLGGEHVHMSVGASIGYDDREISQTQDPSPYFNAALSYTDAHLNRQDASAWCLDSQPAVTLVSSEEEVSDEESEEASEETTSEEPEENFSAVIEDLIHTVVEGDTLYGIAEQYGISLADILSANVLEDLDFLSLGQEIVIPGVPGTTTTDDSGEGDVDSGDDSGTREYTVVEGDTLSAIAALLGIDIEAILNLNDLEDPDFLNIGDILNLP